MNDILFMFLAFIAGIGLGILFFGGLWLTVKKMVISKMPAFLFLSSFVFRTAVTLLGFYYVSLGNWQRLIICMAGFITARYMIKFFTKVDQAAQISVNKEAYHEA